MPKLQEFWRNSDCFGILSELFIWEFHCHLLQKCSRLLTEFKWLYSSFGIIFWNRFSILSKTFSDSLRIPMPCAICSSDKILKEVFFCALYFILLYLIFVLFYFCLVWILLAEQTTSDFQAPICTYHKLIFKRNKIKMCGLSRDLNPGPLAPKARIIPLDHWAAVVLSWI